MAISTASKLIDRIRRAAYPPDAAGVTDEQLLASFHDRHDQTAFAALVRRHGPMVMGVCRRVLGHTHDAEDAFQVTFLVLARKATAIGQPQLLGNWLYGVALRTAQDARKLAVRRRVHEKQVHTMPDPSVEPEANCRESQQYLDLELGRLADKYRVPVVLCELQGRSRKEVASLLGVPEGTVSSRLATARKVLAGRLAARGVVLAAGALTTALPAQTAGAAVPAALIQTTVQAAMALTAGPTAATALLSAELTSLLEGVLRTMALTQLKKAATVLLLAAAMFAGGAGLVSHRVLADKPAPTEPNAASPAENQAEPQATTVTGKFVSFKEGLLTIKLVGPEAKETAWKVAGDTRTVLVIANIAKEGTAQNTLTRIEPGAIVAVTIQDGKATHIQVGTSEAAAPGRDEPKPRSGSGRFLTFKNGALKVENPAGILVWNKLPENARVFEYRDDASGYQAAGAEQALRQVKVGTWVHVNADKREIHIGAKKTFVTGTFVSFKNGTLLLLGRPEEIGPSFAKKYGNNLSFSKLPENIPVFASIDGGDYQPSGTVATAFKDVKEGAVVRVHAEGEGNLTVIQIGVPKKQ